MISRCSAWATRRMQMMITQMGKKDRVAGLGGKEENLVSYMFISWDSYRHKWRYGVAETGIKGEFWIGEINS